MSLDRLFSHIETFQKRAEEEEVEPPTLRRPVTNPIPVEYQRFARELEELTNTTISADDFLLWLKTVGNINIGAVNIKYIASHLTWWMESENGTQYLEAVASRSKVFRLFTSAQKVVDVHNSIFIPGAGVVPKLWLYLGDFIDKPFMHSSKELSHNFFIWDALKAMFNLKEDQYDIAEVEEFTQKYKTKINKCRALFTHEPKFIAAGSDGAAFNIGPSLVLKIFRDPTAYRAARDAVQRLHSNPEVAKTEAMIYDVDSIGEFKDAHIFYYVIEKVTPVHDVSDSLPGVIRPLILKISEYLLARDQTLKEFKKTIDQEDDKTIKGVVSTISESVAKILANDKLVEQVNVMVPQLKPNWLVNFIEEIAMKFLTNRTDLHTGNLGVTNQGDLRYFDPAFEGFESKIHVGGQKFVH